MAIDPAVLTLFNAAIDEIERAAAIEQVGDAVVAAFVYSGGHNTDFQRNIPALHLTQTAAVADWKDRAIKWLATEHAATFRFAEVPKVEKLIMTETGEMGGQRLTATRYGVTSKLAVLSRKPEAEPKPRKKTKRSKR